MLSSMYVQFAVSSDNERIRQQLERLRSRVDGKDISGKNEISGYIADIHEKCLSNRFGTTVLPMMEESGKISRYLLDEFTTCRNSISESCFLLTCFPWDGRDTEEGRWNDRVRLYISQIEELIDRKEVSLFEQAKAVLSDEKWFEIAEAFMEDETGYPEYGSFYCAHMMSEGKGKCADGLSVPYR